MNQPLTVQQQGLQSISRTLRSPQYRQQLAKAFGVGDDDPMIDRFERVAMRAVQEDPKLLNADRNSLYLSCQAAALDNLMPDGRQGKLIVYKTKQDNNQWIEKVQWQRMIGGLRVLAARVGYDLLAEVVYANDSFKHRKGSAPGIDHEPALLGTERGDIIGFYAVATHLKTGKQYFEVMTKADVDKVAQTSKSKDQQGNLVGPWRDWYDEQGRKTVAKRLFKSLPLFDDDEKVSAYIRRDNEEYGEEAQPTTSVAEPPAPAARQTRPVALQAVVDAEVIEGTAAEVETQPAAAPVDSSPVAAGSVDPDNPF